MPNIKRAVTSGLTKPGTAIPDVPDAPTIGTATNIGTSRAFNNGAATVTFTAPATGGTATSYTATSSPGGFTGTGTSPITVTGLASATSYTFTVRGTNTTATGTVSAASNSVTATTVPQAPTIGTVTDGGTGTTVSIPYTAGATGGSTITNYQFVSNPATTTQTSTSNPYTFTGLTTGTAYTFTVAAINANGTSAASSASNSVTPVIPPSFESIASFTADGTAAEYTFSSIPQTYKHLQIRIIARTSGNYSDSLNIDVRFNGLTGASTYHGHYLYGNGGGIASAFTDTGRSSSIYIYKPIYAGGSASYVGAAIMDIADYSSTSKNKTIKIVSGSEANGTITGYVTLSSMLWSRTNAISSIFLQNTAGVSFATGTVISLYGIRG